MVIFKQAYVLCKLKMIFYSNISFNNIKTMKSTTAWRRKTLQIRFTRFFNRQQKIRKKSLHQTMQEEKKQIYFELIQYSKQSCFE